ncbi:MAG: DUF3800 domain-containing protein [Bacteroidales bacterium]|nr:DUF3800 domain-containing protein [Bacteroidales bacterium]
MENEEEIVPKVEEKLKKEQKIIQERDALLAAILAGQRDTIRERVGFLLSQFPELRDSDISLQIKYWSFYQSDNFADSYLTIDQYKNLEHLNSITRARARIQNTLKLFQASEEVKKHRGVLQEEELEKARQAKDIFPYYAIFMDESGKNENYLIIGSLWFLDSSSMTNISTDLLRWKKEKKISWEFHFQKISDSNFDTYCRFVDFFTTRNPIVSFKSIYVERKGLKNVQDSLCKLAVLLLYKGIQHENDTGRAILPRSLQFYKDSEEIGADKLFLEEVKMEIENLSASQFNNQINIDQIIAIESKDNPIMQITDLYTASLNRKINNPGTGTNIKDKFAEYFINAINHNYGKEEKDSDLIYTIAL